MAHSAARRTCSWDIPVTPKFRKDKWSRIFHYALGGVLLFPAAVTALVVRDWLLGLFGVLIGLFIMFGRPRVYRPAITRNSDAIVCRYVPWYETGPYIGVVFVPLLGIFGIALASRPDFSSMIGVLGVLLLAFTPFVLRKFLRGQRRCLLQITPTNLSVPLPRQLYAMAEIPRGLIQSITPTSETVGFGSTTLLITEIAFSPDSSGTQPDQSVRVGPAPATDTVWLTVEPSNLLAALKVWKQANPDDPAVLDRIEAALRSNSRVAAAPRTSPDRSSWPHE